MSEFDEMDIMVNVKFAIRNAVAGTAAETGLVAGEATEILISAIYAEISNPRIRWAIKALAEKS